MPCPALFRSLIVVLFSFGSSSWTSAADLPRKIAGPFTNPESVCLGPDGALYVTEIGEFGVDGDGKITRVEGDQMRPFASGLDDPKGIVFVKEAFYVTDKTRVVRVDAQGKSSVFVAADAFAAPPQFLNDVAVDGAQNQLLVSDSGDLNGAGGAVYRIDLKTAKVSKVADAQSLPGLHTPNGVAFDGEQNCLIADFGTGALYRVKFADGSHHKIASGMEGADGLVWDHYGRLFLTSWTTGKVFAIPRPGESPILIGEGLESAADFCLSADGRQMLIPDMKAGTLTALATTIPGWEVDESPLPIAGEVAFPNLTWTGWDDGVASGKVNPLRPIVLTHAGDGSNRVFVATQQGVIHVFDNDDNAAATRVFLDITPRVRYADRQNEEGLLGLAFHPRFAETGEFFVFYTDVTAKMANVVSRFRVKADDKSTADPNSEEELIRFEKPYWNHDGGALAFGPDGMLYISHGDGGAGGDPHGNGQNLKTLLGKVLRIDVDRKSPGKNYAVPADNPFVENADALPEIWAYGLRNVWRMAFDRETNLFWGGEVGQNLFEEIVLIERGGNYGWNLREALHPFGANGVDVRDDLIEPIWEYHHDVGKSITGGFVYRGTRIPELQGAYVYADYVSTRMWALRYDSRQGRVTANHPLPPRNLTILSFGEDERGELYALCASPTGRGIYRLVKAEAGR